KVAAVNNSKEENRFVNLDWHREFDSFFSADIHNTSLNGKYLVDTSRIVNDTANVLIIRYIAKEEGLKTRLLEIHFDSANNVELLKAELYSKNFVASLSESLYYEPQKTYSIANHEESRWFG